MGTFQGHILPGTFFISFSIFWILKIIRRRMLSGGFRSSGESIIEYKNSVTYNCPCILKSDRIPYESLIKLLCCLGGMIGELIAAFIEKEIHLSDIQHSTMYFGFLVSSITEIKQFYRRNNNDNDTNTDDNDDFKKLPYVLSAFAFAIQAFLFYTHPHTVSKVEQRLHSMLVLCAIYCCLSIIVEMKNARSVFCAYTKCHAVLLNGIWFWVVAFVLYPPAIWLPKWKLDDEKYVMLATMVFIWSWVFCFVLLSFVHCLARRFYGKYLDMRGTRYRYRSIEKDDEESAVSFQMLSTEINNDGE